MAVFTASPDGAEDEPHNAELPHNALNAWFELLRQSAELPHNAELPHSADWLPTKALEPQTVCDEFVGQKVTPR